MAGFRSKANWALAAVTAGYLASYPFSNTFAGGLISSACGAAMVGGIADWFAITALFKQPLGISWRTGLIPRNRDKILQIIVHMVEQELLTTANIRQTLVRYDIPAIILQYLTNRNGAAQVKALLGEAALRFARDADKKELGRTMEIMLRKEFERLELAPLLGSTIEWSLHSGYGDKIIYFLIDECKRLAASDQAPALFSQVFTGVRSTYEQGMARRKIFNLLASEVMGLTPEKAGLLAQQQVIHLLSQWQQADHPMRDRLRNWLVTLAGNLKTDSQLQETVERWKREQFAKSGFLQEHILVWAERFWHADGSGTLEQRLHGLVDNKVDDWINEFSRNRELQQQIDGKVKQVFIQWLDSHHKELGLMVRQKLSGLSAADLTAFVEAKAGNDLQMIRINGSVVGGILGMVLYGATWWLR